MARILKARSAVLVSKKFARVMKYHRISMLKAACSIPIQRATASSESFLESVVYHWERNTAFFRAKSSKQFLELESSLLEAPFIARACPPIECDNLNMDEVLQEANESGLGGPPMHGQVPSFRSLWRKFRTCT